MSKKNNAGETIFAVVCVAGLVAVLFANDGGAWLHWLQNIMAATATSNDVSGAVEGSAVGMLVQAALGFAVVFAVGGGAMWLRNRGTVDVDVDGTPQIDYRSPEWVNVRVIQ